LITAEKNGTVRFWNGEFVADSDAVGPPGGKPGCSAMAAAISPAGDTLAYSEADAVRLWAANRSAARRQIEVSPETIGTRIIELTFSQDGELLAGAGRDGRIHLWREQRHEGRRFFLLDPYIFPVAPNNLTSVALAPDGSLLAGGSESGEMKVYDLATSPPKPLKLESLQRGSSAPHNDDTEVALSRKRVASVGINDRLLLWDARTGRLAAAPVSHGGSIVALSPNDEYVAVGRIDGKVTVWRVPDDPEEKPVELPGFETPYPDTILGLRFSPCGKQLLVLTSRWVHIQPLARHQKKGVHRLLPGFGLPNGAQYVIQQGQPSTRAEICVAVTLASGTVTCTGLALGDASLEGDPSAIFHRFQFTKLALKIDRGGDIVPAEEVPH
jgi:WD40 repeat protein